MSIPICSLTWTEGSSQVAGADLHIFKDVAGAEAPLLSGLDSAQRALSAYGFTIANCLLLGKSKRNVIIPGSLEWLPMSRGPIQNINVIRVRPQVKSKEELYVYRLLH